MKITILIPARNEESTITGTVKAIYQKLEQNRIEHEILVINDHSTDQTSSILNALKQEVPTLAIHDNNFEAGFGNAIRFGLEHCSGHAIAIVMADGAEEPEDVVKCFRIMQDNNAAAVFGSRFIKGGSVHNYPFLSLVLNRLFNNLLRLLFFSRFNDFTNSFKLYSLEVIEAIKPLKATNFSITIELSLKTLNYTKNVKFPPIKWYNREKGKSKFNLLKNLPGYLRVVFDQWRNVGKT